jgi:transglutaminase-like putative cysteine protease
VRFARVHKLAAYVLAVLGLVALCAGGELGGLPTVLLAIGVVGSWFAEGEMLQSPRYLRAWNIAVVAMLVLEVARATLAGLPPLTAAVEFAALLQLSRLANRRTARDYNQITVLAMLHLIAATVLGGGLSYAACFLGFVVVTPWAMTLGHLRREIEGNYLADARAGRAGVPIDVARILRSRRVVGPGLLLGSSLLAIPIFALTSLIFVLFPRIGLGIVSIRASHGPRVTGLGDQVDLSGHGTIRDDPTIVLRIEPPDLGTDPPPFRTFRLRGAVFDRYDGRIWTRTPRHRGSLERVGDVYAIAGFEHQRHARYRITLDALDPPIMLLPPNTVAVRIEPRIESGVPRYPDVTRNDALEIRYNAPDDLGLVYTAFVAPEVPGGGDGSRLSPEARARYLALPPLSPRVRELAHRLTDGLQDARAKADAVARHLQSFRYTLTLESGRAEQPIEDFLFRTHAGHCEYFSTAMAVLLRSVGVPTRNVTGFLGGTYNRYGRFYAIRQGDAHSWVEVYDPARGWITFDPTPPAREVPVARTGVLAEIDAVMEALRARWRQYVVSFDLGTQARIAMRVMRMLERRHARPGTEGRAGPPSPHAWDDFVNSLKRAARALPWRAIVLAVAVGVPLALWLLRRWRARAVSPRAPHRPHHVQVREAIALARALDTALAARGHVRPPSRSPLGFAEDLARAGSPLAPLAYRVAQRYVAARFGDAPLRAGEFDALRRELRNA